MDEWEIILLEQTGKPAISDTYPAVCRGGCRKVPCQPRPGGKMSVFDPKLLTGAFYVAYIYINANFQEYIVYTLWNINCMNS